MTTTSEKFHASSSLVEPTTENETQPSTGNTHKIVEINNESFKTWYNGTKGWNNSFR